MTNNLKKQFQEVVWAKFTSDLESSLKSKECKQFFIELMQRAIEEAVYNRYTPTGYERRRDKGGLQDPKNYEYYVELRGGAFYISMKNRTQGKKNSLEIDRIIVTGEGYDWVDSVIYKIKLKRDFYGYMENTLMPQEVEKLKRIIKMQMNKKGWK